jgi:hypothetical protein
MARKRDVAEAGSRSARRTIIEHLPIILNPAVAAVRIGDLIVAEESLRYQRLSLVKCTAEQLEIVIAKGGIRCGEGRTAG